MSGGRVRRWAFLILMGWAGCGSPPARLTPATPETPAPIPPTATPTRAGVPTPTRTPTKPPPATASPTARPTAAKAQAFMPRPFPDGFQTEGNWIALEVDTYRQDGERERSDLWFTDGQRWLGPIPLRGGEDRSLQKAFGRRQGESIELCATLATRSVCTPAPPGISLGAPEPSSIRAEACRDGQAICTIGPDGSTREFPLPADLIEGWQARPLCVSRDRWVIVEVFERFKEGEEGVSLPSRVYRLDMARGIYELVSGTEEARAERIRAFQRQGVLPEWISWAYDPQELEPEMCSPDTRFYLMRFGGGMGGSEDSAWILRVEDGALYPLPGPQAQWVRLERGGR